jgi:hypothetical protein
MSHIEVKRCVDNFTLIAVGLAINRCSRRSVIANTYCLSASYDRPVTLLLLVVLAARFI